MTPGAQHFVLFQNARLVIKNHIQSKEEGEV